jgi:hypothetical protein
VIKKDIPMATVFIEKEWIETAKLLGDVRSILKSEFRGM